MAKYGYGNDDSYEKIRQDIRKSPLFRFNFFIKSRTTHEIFRRCQTLVSLIVKEHEPEHDKEDRKRKKDDAGASGANANAQVDSDAARASKVIKLG